LFYGFDEWHISPFYERTYAVQIVEYLNNLVDIRNYKIAEIGCGLGDIIRRVKATSKLGFDYDYKVCKAANFVSKILNDKTKYAQFKFPDDSLSSTYDAIIMVNWIHHIEPVLLKEQLAVLFHEHLSLNGKILVDTVQDEQYQFNHDINFLTASLNCELEVIATDKRQRKVFAIKRIN
jgi:SAM-dependent methyltransferase